MACDPFWNKTVLACHFDGSNGSTTFTDEKGHTLTANGNAQLTTTSPKFGTACATFDGTGDYVVCADDADLELGGSDFTIELWIKTTQTLTYACPLGRDTGAFPAGSWAILLNGPGSGYVQFWNASYSGGSAMLGTSASVSINDGNWHHIAVVRLGGATSLYVDGAVKASVSWTGSVADIAYGINIGRDPGYARDFNGYIDDLRITKAARYTGNFTPDTSAFLTNQCTISGTVKDATGANAQRLVRVLDRKTCSVLNAGLSDVSTGAYSLPVATTNEVMVLANDAVGDPFWNKTVLACHFDGSNGSTTFTDECGHMLTAVGNAQISTAQSKFGGASLYLDGNGDYVSLDAAILSAHATDVTIECWFKLNGTPTGNAYNTSYFILSFGPNNANSGCDFYVGNTQIRFNHYDYSVNILSGGWTPDTNWHHVAVVRSGNAWALYLDGTSIATNSNSTAFLTHTGTLAIGGCEAQSGGVNTGWFNGYIDDLRITKAARYTGNFTPDTSAFLGAPSGGTENAVILDRVVPV